MIGLVEQVKTKKHIGGLGQLIDTDVIVTTYRCMVCGSWWDDWILPYESLEWGINNHIKTYHPLEFDCWRAQHE